MRQTIALVGMLLIQIPLTPVAEGAESVPAWRNGRPLCALVLPDGNERAARLGKTTFSRFMRAFYGLELPVSTGIDAASTYVVLGTPGNNASLGQLVRNGLALGTPPGDEGFELLTHEDAKSKYVIIHAATPRALKHGCQELLFYHLPATADGGSFDWPLKLARQPEIAYRGIYMLPCWAAHDSIESWRTVLRFTSELTLNRTWFWLDGFPVAGHAATSHVAGQASDYGTTDLASDANVQSLIDLINDEDMKFYIGGGWMSWHQEQAVGKDAARSLDYYRAYLRTFRNVGGFYFEPTGEGSEDKDWRAAGESLRTAINHFTRENPQFEIAVAIGQFNNPDYLKIMSDLDPARVYWWWCWGDPLKNKAPSLYPSVLGWHTTRRMSNFHGRTTPPGPDDLRLAGFATSYDPGMGFGNPWNGWPKLGVSKPRNFHPHTLPYFSHEYRFRERCWDTALTDEQFARRLARRLFDADMPAEAVDHYLKLASLCPEPEKTSSETIDTIDAFVTRVADRGTPRNRDTLLRMREAIDGLRTSRKKP